MPAPRAFTLFDTPIGRCGLAWGARGLVGVQLPERHEAASRARVRARFPGAVEAPPPPAVQRALAAITTHLDGKASDLSDVAVDMAGVPSFHRRVYEVARAIPPGATLTYGDVATRAGAPGAARAVGQTLRRNPFAIVVPCHRVLAAGSKVGGFTADGGIATKLRLLAIEGTQPNGVAAPSGRIALGFGPQAAVMHLQKIDPVLARLIEAVGPCTMELKKTRTIFGALAEAIVYQQLNGKAAATIFGRVCALFPRAAQGPTAEHVMRATDAQLRGAGLSRAKLLALRDLARRSAAGEIPTLAQAQRLDDAAIIERLTAVRGIGRWTVEMLLMFRLGRPDVLPLGDYGIRKGFAVAFRKAEMPAKADVERRGARWKPYRTVASWYLWRAAERASRRRPEATFD